MNIDKLSDFLEYLKKRGYNKSTIDGYYYGLKKFFIYLHENHIDQIKFSKQDVIKYRDETLKKFSAQTTNVILAAIKKYLEYLKITMNVKINWDWDIDVKKNNRKKDLIFIEDIQKLFNHIKKINSNAMTQLRDNLIITMLYYTGIRCQDLIKIKKENITNGVLKINNKKIILNKKLQQDIQNYITKVKIGNDEYLFFATSRNNVLPLNNGLNKNKHITTRSIENIFNRYKGIINDNLSINDLRNSHKLILKNKSFNIKIDKIYSHNIVTTSNNYLNLAQKVP